MAEEDVVDNAARVGRYLHGCLGELARASERLGEVRGSGLLAGIEVLDADGNPDATGAQTLVDGLRRRRVLISATGRHGNVLKIRPPLVFAREHVDRLRDALAASLAG